MSRLRLALVAAAVLAACAARRGPGPSGPPGLDEAAARETLRRFATAVEAGAFDAAAPLLAARWRAGYTPGRLALDARGAGPEAREAAGRLLAALDAGAPLLRDGARAVLPTAPGRAAVVVAEGGRWRVDAIE